MKEKSGKVEAGLRKRYALLIEIPEKRVMDELGAFYKVAERWGQQVAWTYLVKHPDMIEPNLELLGVGELWHPRAPRLKKGDPQRIDLLFRKGNVYYPVEVMPRKKMWNQLSKEVECFKYAMKEQRVQYEEIVPVLVVYGDKEYNRERYHWPQWWLGPLRDEI